MSRKFSDFMKELEAEARREGPRAVAEMTAFEAHFRLAREVLELRRLRRMTQRQLATRAGLQQAEISRIEAGHANPTLTTLGVLARALGAELRLSAAPRRRARGASDPHHRGARSSQMKIRPPQRTGAPRRRALPL